MAFRPGILRREMSIMALPGRRANVLHVPPTVPIPYLADKKREAHGRNNGPVISWNLSCVCAHRARRG